MADGSKLKLSNGPKAFSFTIQYSSCYSTLTWLIHFHTLNHSFINSFNKHHLSAHYMLHMVWSTKMQQWARQTKFSLRIKSTWERNMVNKEIELCYAGTVQSNACKHTARIYTSLGEMSEWSQRTILWINDSWKIPSKDEQCGQTTKEENACTESPRPKGVCTVEETRRSLIWWECLLMAPNHNFSDKC